MNQIEYSTKVLRQLRKLPEAAHIRDKINTLAHMPDCANVKKLVNHEYQYRLRVGNYRVFFNFDGAIQIVSIEEVKKRDDNTY